MVIDEISIYSGDLELGPGTNIGDDGGGLVSSADFGVHGQNRSVDNRLLLQHHVRADRLLLLGLGVQLGKAKGPRLVAVVRQLHGALVAIIEGVNDEVAASPGIGGSQLHGVSGNRLEDGSIGEIGLRADEGAVLLHHRDGNHLHWCLRNPGHRVVGTVHLEGPGVLLSSTGHEVDIVLGHVPFGYVCGHCSAKT